MSRSRTRRVAAATGAAALLLAATATAADAPSASLKASISPNSFGKLKSGVGHSLKLSLAGTVVKTPSDTEPVMTKMVITLPAKPYAVMNGRLFPSCTAQKITLNRGQSGRACPRGARVGGGPLTARVPSLHQNFGGTINVFNGPGGRSLVFQVVFINPVDLNVSFNVPLVQRGGHYVATAVVPDALRNIPAIGIAALNTFKTTVGGTVVTKVGKKKVKRGWIEPLACPRVVKPLPAKIDLTYQDGSRTSASTAIRFSCKR